MGSERVSRFFGSKLFWLGSFVAVLSFSAIVLPYWRPLYWTTRSQLAAAKAAIREQGEPVTFLDLRASDEAGYQMGDDVARLFTRLGKSTSDFQEAVISSPPVSPENVELMRRELDGNREAMNAIAAVEPVSQCRFRYDFTVASPSDTLLPSVDAVIKASYLWRADVAVSLHSADYEQAVTAVEELCDVGELLSHEPSFVSQVVRARIGNQAIDGLEQVLTFANLSTEQFTALDQRLAMMECTFRLAETVKAERSSLLTTMQNIGHPDVRKSLNMRAGFGSGGRLLSFAPKSSLIDEWASLSYMPELMRQQTWMLRQMTAAANLIDKPGPDASEQWNGVKQETSRTLASMEDTPLSELFPAFSQLRDKGLTYRQRLLAARLALRVIRHRHSNQSLSNSLTDVLDADLSSIPLSLWDYSEPELRIRPDGIDIIYSNTGVEGAPAPCFSVAIHRNASSSDLSQ